MSGRRAGTIAEQAAELTVANVVSLLESKGLLGNCIIVVATAGDSAPLQYIAPFAGCSMAEEFMWQGKHTLVVYDDLTAHANRQDLLDFVGQVSPRAVLLGHGNEASRKWFEQQIRSRHPKIKIIQPQTGRVVEP